MKNGTAATTTKMYHYPIPTGLGLQQLLLICDKLDFTMDK
jgi:hypothetical protein